MQIAPGALPYQSSSIGSPETKADEEKTRVAEAMLNDTVNYPFVGNVIDHLKIGRMAFYRYFPPGRLRELRNQP